MASPLVASDIKLRRNRAFEYLRSRSVALPEGAQRNSCSLMLDAIAPRLAKLGATDAKPRRQAKRKADAGDDDGDDGDAQKAEKIRMVIELSRLTASFSIAASCAAAIVCALRLNAVYEWETSNDPNAEQALEHKWLLTLFDTNKRLFNRTFPKHEGTWPVLYTLFYKDGDSITCRKKAKQCLVCAARLVDSDRADDTGDTNCMVCNGCVVLSGLHECALELVSEEDQKAQVKAWKSAHLKPADNESGSNETKSKPKPKPKPDDKEEKPAPAPKKPRQSKAEAVSPPSASTATTVTRPVATASSASQSVSMTASLAHKHKFEADTASTEPCDLDEPAEPSSSQPSQPSQPSPSAHLALRSVGSGNKRDKSKLRCPCCHKRTSEKHSWTCIEFAMQSRVGGGSSSAHDSGSTEV